MIREKKIQNRCIPKLICVDFVEILNEIAGIKVNKQSMTGNSEHVSSA